MKVTLVGVYLLIAALSWPLTSGMIFSDVQSICTSGPGCSELYRRKDIGFAIFTGAFMAAVWPIGLPATFCMSGFAEHGLWTAGK